MSEVHWPKEAIDQFRKLGVNPKHMSLIAEAEQARLPQIETLVIKKSKNVIWTQKARVEMAKLGLRPEDVRLEEVPDPSPQAEE